MFEKTLPTYEHTEILRHLAMIETAEDDGMDELHLEIGQGHVTDKGCWCEPCGYNRPSGMKVFLHRGEQ